MAFKKMTAFSLLFGEETVEGQDAGLDGSNYLTPIMGTANFSPVVTERVPHNVYDGTFGTNPGSSGSIRSQLSFQVAFRGPGAGITAATPVIGELIKCCGFDETLNAATDVRYTQNSDFPHTGTAYLFYDGVKYVMLGCRGQLDIIGTIGGLLLFEVSLLGLKGPHTDTAAPANTTVYPTQPFVVREVSSVWTIQAFEVAGRQFNYTANSPSSFFETTKDEQIVPTAFDPSSSVTCKVENFADFDPISITENDTSGPCTFNFGNVAGNQLSVSTPTSQLTVDGKTEEENVVLYQMTVPHNKNTGDDAVELIMT